MENKITETKIMDWVPSVAMMGHTTNEQCQTCVELDDITGLQLHMNGVFDAGTRTVKIGDKFVVDTTMGLSIFVPVSAYKNVEDLKKAQESSSGGIRTIVFVGKVYGVDCVVFDPDPQMAPGIIHSEEGVLIERHNPCAKYARDYALWSGFAVREQEDFLRIEGISRSKMNCFITRWKSTMGYNHREWYDFDLKFNGACPIKLSAS